MGRRDGRIEWQIAQTAAKLRLADPAVTKKKDLDLRVDPLAEFKVFVVGADFIQDVLELCLSADFRVQIIQFAAEQVEFFQRGQQGFERGKPGNAYAARQVERLERGEAGQRG